MVTAGDATGTMIKRVAALLEPGDCIVDAGNSYYRDSIRDARSWVQP
jgi:6-phosphogluconate dehydrogenase